MANVVRDPREHPDAIIPDLSKPDPLLTFSKDDITFVYGSQRREGWIGLQGLRGHHREGSGSVNQNCTAQRRH
jgi:hypothetical protein